MAQVTLVKFSLGGKSYEVDSLADDLTMNSFTGDGAYLTDLNASNISSGVLDKQRLDPSMAGDGVGYDGGVLSAIAKDLGGLGVGTEGSYVNHDGSLQIIGGKLSVASTGGATLAFSTFATFGQTDIIAQNASDILTWVAGDGMSITTDSLTRSMEISSAITSSLGIVQVGNDFRLDTSHASFWTARQSIAGFTGVKLDVQAHADDTDTSLIEVRDDVGDTLFAVDAAGAVFANDLNANLVMAQQYANVYLSTSVISAGAPVYQVGGADDSVLHASALTGGNSLVGIAINSAIIGGDVFVAISGKTAIPSGRIDGGALTRGAPVYLSDTAGNVTSTPPTNVYQIGVATSSTSMFVNINY